MLNDKIDRSVCSILNLSGCNGRKRAQSANKFLKDVLARSVKCFLFEKLAASIEIIFSLKIFNQL